MGAHHRKVVGFLPTVLRCLKPDSDMAKWPTDFQPPAEERSQA